jgi:hypothetical protein
MRFSLKWLLLTIGFVAVALAALLMPSPWLKAAMFFALWWSCMIAALRLIPFRTPKRAFAGGYLLASVAFITLTVTQPTRLNMFDPIKSVIDNDLATPLHGLLAPTLAARRALPGYEVQRIDERTFILGKNTFGKNLYYETYGEINNTRSVLEIVTTILVGCIGGGIAVRFNRTGSPPAFIGSHEPSRTASAK